MIAIAHLQRVDATDVRQLNALAQALHGDDRAATVAEINNLCAHASLIVALDGEAFIGMATLYLLPMIGRIQARIEEVFVDRFYRRQGIAVRLIRHAIRLATTHGALTIDLNTRSSRSEALGLYRKLGFEQRDTNVF